MVMEVGERERWRREAEVDVASRGGDEKEEG